MCVQKTLRNHIDSEFDAAIGMGAYNEDESHKGLYIMGSSITNAREAIKDLFFRKDDEKVGDQSVNEIKPLLKIIYPGFKLMIKTQLETLEYLVLKENAFFTQQNT